MRKCRELSGGTVSLKPWGMSLDRLATFRKRSCKSCTFRSGKAHFRLREIKAQNLQTLKDLKGPLKPGEEGAGGEVTGGCQPGQGQCWGRERMCGFWALAFAGCTLTRFKGCSCPWGLLLSHTCPAGPPKVATK